MVIGGAASVVTAIGWWFGFPDLRRTDRFPRMGGPDPNGVVEGPVETGPPAPG